MASLAASLPRGPEPAGFAPIWHWRWRPPLSSRPPAWLAQRLSLAHHPYPSYITSRRPLPPAGFWSTPTPFSLPSHHPSRLPSTPPHPSISRILVEIDCTDGSASTLPTAPSSSYDTPSPPISSRLRYQFRFESPKNRHRRRPSLIHPDARYSINHSTLSLLCRSIPPAPSPSPACSLDPQFKFSTDSRPLRPDTASLSIILVGLKRRLENRIPSLA
ncbi:hypothetical protein A1Q2_01990 [Trichosporon asahii var. asahii CBS 8904]|uniref:Uncharacterized protein n=1 Tax=Trichosporon asahii var. asahii (strain CBS 8904) TaxID=1220162 RepID=K1WRZ2_TRIAC|nr:hypothetical protein A1Q2_01990 [Trichosporon asahii var. asahii CBS 8904]